MILLWNGSFLSPRRVFGKRGSSTTTTKVGLLRFGILVLQLVLLFTVRVGYGSTWYVDINAKGANTGTSRADAWTSITNLDRNYGHLASGDTAVIFPGTYPEMGDINLKEGTTNNWTSYYFTNGPVKVFTRFLLRGFTDIEGSLSPNYETNIVSTYDVQKVTNNTGLWIYRWTNFYNVGSGGRSIMTFDLPVIVRWVHITGCTNIDTPVASKSDSASEIFLDSSVNPISSHSEIGYCWIDQSSGHGAGASISTGPRGTEFGCFNIHHVLDENIGSDVTDCSGGMDWHHCIIRNRQGNGGQQCNDTFVVGGNTSYVRIWNNLVEPADNTLMYLWGNYSNIHDFYFYGNVLTPVHRAYQAQTAQGSGVWEQGDTLTPVGHSAHLTTNIFLLNNTWIGTTNDGPGAFINLITKNNLDYDLIVDPGAVVLKNNLCVEIDTNATSLTFNPFALGVGCTTGWGTNILGYGWYYSSNSFVLDYNQFFSYSPGNLIAATWGDSGYLKNGGSAIRLTSSADIARVLGYTHNVSSAQAYLVDAQNFDYRPATSAVNIGQDLSSLTNLMPDLDQDIFGRKRGLNGSWSAGAIEYQTIVPTAPTITVQPSSQTNTVGATVTFSVGATGSSPLSYQWSFNGTAISGASSMSYTRNNISTSDAGSYAVVVSNPYGTTSSSAATLAVSVVTGSAPVITSQPASQSVEVGGPAMFTVSASGSAPLIYQWQKNGANLAGATQSSYTIANTSTNDTGAFSAVIGNSYGSVTSQAAMLTVTNSGSLSTSTVTNGLVLWLTFDLSDGWTTNHVITDKSGLGNHAYYMPSTNRNTWPSWTSGPNGLSAAQFVVDLTNSAGFRQGTYAAITSLSTNAANSGLAYFTKGTWACWAYIDNAHILGDSGDDMFLSTGQGLNNWFFGKYYSNGAQFSRASTGGGQEPLETYAKWPSVSTSTGWQHYAISWDGTNFTSYLNGVAWTNSSAWVDNNTFVLTNQFTGTLISTNDIGGVFNWIAVGVNSHGGTPAPDDADGLPNNGQLWGRLADIRIYNRPLSAAEIGAVYLGTSTVADRPSPPTGLRILASP